MHIFNFLVLVAKRGEICIDHSLRERERGREGERERVVLSLFSFYLLGLYCVFACYIMSFVRYLDDHVFDHMLP